MPQMNSLFFLSRKTASDDTAGSAARASLLKLRTSNGSGRSNGT